MTLGRRYELVEAVGSGGAGEVWLATDEMLDRPVAVKVLRPELAEDEGTVRRFAAEARFMAQLNHPGVATVYDFGKDPDGTAYLVMRFVEGESLRTILARRGPLPAALTMRIVAEAAEALDAAHAGGVIHRDVKPGNLMVRSDGSIILTDFGIARAAGSDATGAGLVLGTARYLAPEQAAGDEITPAVDVYALGVLAYECLAGGPPFDGPNPVAVAMRHIEEEPPPLPNTVPAPVRALVTAMMAKDARQRPSAAAVVMAARAAATAPAAPRPGDPRRRRQVLVGTAAGILAMATALFVATLGPSAPPAGSSATDDGRPVGSGVGMTQLSPGATGRSPVIAPELTPPPTGPHRTTGAAVRSTPATRPAPGGTVPGTAAPATTRPAPTSGPPPSPSPSPPQQTPVEVPSVIGLPRAEAATVLTDAGLTASVSTVYGPSCAVVAQDPAAGTLVQPGSTVSVTFEGDGSCPV